MRTTNEDLIDPATACEVLQVQEPELVRMVNEGVVPAYRIAGQVRFRPSELAVRRAA